MTSLCVSNVISMTSLKTLQWFHLIWVWMCFDTFTLKKLQTASVTSSGIRSQNSCFCRVTLLRFPASMWLLFPLATPTTPQHTTLVRQSWIWIWWCLVMFGDIWWCLVVLGGVWWCLAMFGDDWWWFGVFGGVWWCFGLFGSVWWCLVMFGSVCWCLVMLGDVWWC